MLTTICPHCGWKHDVFAALEDADARRFQDLLTSLPEGVHRPMLVYLKLFKPSNQHVLRWSRMLTLTKELAPMIRAARVERDGIVRVAPPLLWAQVLADLGNNPPKTLKLPLKGNGYLLQMVAGAAEGEAARAEKQAEADRVAARLSASRQTPSTGATEPEQKPLTEAQQQANLKRLRDLIGGKS